MVREYREWLTTSEAAEFWNEVIGLTARTIAHPAHEQTMRRFCRDGVFEKRGVRCMMAGTAYIISRNDLAWYIWTVAYDALLRAEESCGISGERRRALIGQVSAEHAGEGDAVETHWRHLMHEEFMRYGTPDVE